MVNINIDEIQVVQDEEGNLSSLSHISTDPSLDLVDSDDGGNGRAGDDGVPETPSYDADSGHDFVPDSDLEMVEFEDKGESSRARGVLIIRRDRAGRYEGAEGSMREGSETQSEPLCVARISESMARLGPHGGRQLFESN
ncbi:unnamed protein product [Linum trigynum]|uniref:Uncharacterized protein n=1 Tax=Linum trigynum TaxID=586398 RepID=A0AAV2DME1_9ROSI